MGVGEWVSEGSLAADVCTERLREGHWGPSVVSRFGEPEWGDPGTGSPTRRPRRDRTFLLTRESVQEDEVGSPVDTRTPRAPSDPLKVSRQLVIDRPLFSLSYFVNSFTGWVSNHEGTDVCGLGPGASL